MDGSLDSSLSRRRFVVAGLSAAGGLALGIAWSGDAAAFPLGALPSSPETVPADEYNAWLVIDPDDSVTIRLPHSELGQGAATGLPMIVAEELECDWAKVRAEYGSANRNLREHEVYGPMMTVGSRGVATTWQILQQVGASARVRLVAAAAQRWGVDPASCAAAQGKVVHQASGRSLGYGALAAAAARIALDKEPAIRPPEQFKLIGKPLPRLDTGVKTDGSAKFGIDTRLPGMVYAAVMSCPVPGGTLKSVDEAPIRGRRGILQVVRLDDAVVVVGDRYWRALQALQALKPEWTVGAAGATNSEQFRKLYRDALDGPMPTARNDGDVEAVLGRPGAKLVEAVYEVPYLAHATMEPLNATVHLQPGRLDVWIGSQAPMAALQLAAAGAGLPTEQVFVHNCFVGGGFGRRSMHDELRQAVAVAKAVGKPVKLIWSREQDMRHDRYRPQAASRFRAVLGADGRPTALDVKAAVGSILRSLGKKLPAEEIEPMAVDGLANVAYRIPNLRIGVMQKNTHVPVMFWRSVGGSQNTFFMESFIDELAHAAGQDPYKFRRAMLDRADFLGVIDMLAEKSGWGSELPAGSGRGIAIAESHGAVIGHVAEVTVNPKGEVRVDRIVGVADCYHAVNPKIIAQQVESGIIFGLSAALYGEITIRNGAVEQGNFDTYPMVRLADSPRIETYLSLSGGNKWGGIGEAGTAPVAPAVANAVFAATGRRPRRLPLRSLESAGAI